MYDACVYMKKKKGNMVIIGLHVDDFFIFSNNIMETERLKREIGKSFKIKDLAELKECLGLQVFRNKKASIIKINQLKYIKEILQRFGMED